MTTHSPPQELDNISMPQFCSSPVIICGFVLATIFFGGCDFSTDPDPLTGEIVGLVQPYDQWNQIITGPSGQKGIKVQLEGTSYSALTDSSGRYVLDDVAASTYTIALSKSGYGTNKLPFYQFVGGGRDFVQGGRPIDLGKTPDYQITLDSIHTTPRYVVCTGSIKATIPEDGQASIVTYVADSSEISNEDPSTYMAIASSVTFPGVTKFTATFDRADLPAGKELYFKSYPVAKSSLFYLDPTAETNKIVFSSLGEPTGVKNWVIQKDGEQSVGNLSFENSLTLSYHKKGSESRIERVTIPADATPEDLVRIREKVQTYTSEAAKAWTR
ncbi:MAG TPA: carboxypeptidase-like regulatory domain-containing protein [Fodinibius sp.]|nr:carboxypeptidase-like regulatory domain-containing protein [Fodinibius sp.]